MGAPRTSWLAAEKHTGPTLTSVQKKKKKLTVVGKHEEL